MRQRLYPTSLAELESWRRHHGVTLDEARKRYAQFVILESIALSAARDYLSFKGGNAVRFIHGNPRSTADLDFTAEPGFPDDKEEIRKKLDEALRRSRNRYELKLRCQRVKRNPPGVDKTMPTYEITVAYQFPNDRHYIDFDSREQINTIIPLDISFNDVVCETSDEQLDPNYDVSIKVCVLEDILAEKLRALLQQPIRNRHRREDVYDISRLVKTEKERIDKKKVAEFFTKKSTARRIQARKSAFDEEVRNRARFDYDKLFEEPDFIPFDEAWQRILDFVSSLDIPD